MKTYTYTSTITIVTPQIVQWYHKLLGKTPEPIVTEKRITIQIGTYTEDEARKECTTIRRALSVVGKLKHEQLELGIYPTTYLESDRTNLLLKTQ